MTPPIRSGRDRDDVPAPQRGFTLIELLVVMGVLGILMGMGMGFLRRRGRDLDVAVTMVRDQLRLAADSAATRHLPASVAIVQGEDGAPATVRARVLAPIAFFHLDEDERRDERAGLETELSGETVPGRFGEARRNDPAQKRSLLRAVVGDRPAFDLRDGFATRLDLRFDADQSEAGEGVVLRIGSTLELRVDEALVPSAKFVGTEGGDQQGRSFTLTTKRSLPTERWVTLELVHDGRSFAMLADGVELARTAAPQRLWQRPEDVLELSPADRPLAALVDEFAIFAYDVSEQQTLPSGITIRAEPAEIAFDRNGDLEAPASLHLSDQDDERALRVGAKGSVE
ncbi:MAG: prepilin-type N-terminal cleavage/methylation domain-containing protein [Planctomycetes bacterium]|nr:prepilin-type N-terminal cleavage/methylation domain-containing protein [Planctomycetota bacterium]